MKNSKAKQNKKLAELRSKLNYVQIMCLTLGILIGLTAGYYIWQGKDSDPRYKLASAAVIKQAKDDISAKFKKQSSLDCDAESDTISPNDRQKVFDKYLQVNKYGNRAVIRGCNDFDSLLVKDPVTGQWQPTSINVSLDLRANPTWQIECMIDDITKPDDVFRSENSSIDSYNLVGCRKIKEREQIVEILVNSDHLKRSEITQENIDAYIKGGEDFN